MIKHNEKTAESPELFPAKSLISVLKSVLASYIFLIAAFTVLALVYTYTNMSEGLLEPAIQALSVISLVLAGFLSARSISSFGWLHGSVSGLVCTLIRIAAGLMVFKSYVPSDGVGKLLLAGIVLGAIGGILGVNIRAGLNKTEKKKRK